MSEPGPVGRPAIAEDLEGELQLVLVTSDTEETAAEHSLEIGGESVTIWRYWGRTVDRDEQVYRVRPAEVADDGSYVPDGPTLSWPESKLTPVLEESEP